MKRNPLALACILPILAACSPQQQTDAAMCGLALYAARATNAAEIIMAAQQVPACRALALDTMQVVIAEVLAKRGIQ